MNKMLLSLSLVTIGMINCADMVIEIKNECYMPITITVHKGLVKSTQGFFDFYGPRLETKHDIFNSKIAAKSSEIITIPAGYNISIFISRDGTYKQYCTLDRAILAGSTIVEVQTAFPKENRKTTEEIIRKNALNNLEVIFIGKYPVELCWSGEVK